jgi:MoxR-like ATPase
MLKLKIDYPGKEQERQILDRMAGTDTNLEVNAVLEPGDIVELREAIDQIYVDPKVKSYLVDLVLSTRNPAEYGLEMTGLIQYGASPRATIALVRAARAQAFLEGRGYVTPQDVKSVAIDVLRHRILISYEAEAEELKPEDLVRRILERLPVP